MNNATHTPGPWATDGQFGFLDVVSSKGRIAMIDCDNDDIFGADIEANARLIAAAPDLLDALETAEKWVAQYRGLDGHDAAARSMLAVITAAIAKAKGQ
jgi:hypothetical protein